MKKKTQKRSRSKSKSLSPSCASAATSRRNGKKTADSLQGLCALERGEECPNRVAVKDPNKFCEREVAFRARVLKRLRNRKSTGAVDPKELEEPYCLYPQGKTLEVAHEDIEKQYGL